MENILLIMPFFREYDQCLNNALRQKYHVVLINSEQFSRDIVDRYQVIRKRMRYIRAIASLRPKIDLWNRRMACDSFNDSFMSLVSPKKNAYQAVLCINCQCVGDGFLRTLRKKNPAAKFVYYMWDDSCNLFRLPDTSCFDRVLSYNMDECRQRNWEYLPVFTQRSRIGHSSFNQYDIAFVGTAHPNRIELAQKIFNRYSDCYKIYIYLYDPLGCGGQFCHKEPLEYDKYMEIMKQSAVFLDDPYEGQTGPTTRVFDALQTDTKVLTTNASISHYPVYSRNIAILDRDDLVISPEFISQPYYETEYQPLTVNNWLEAIGL